MSFRVVDLNVEGWNKPLATFTDKPRLSWNLESDRHNTFQTSYCIQAAKNADFSNIIWQKQEETSECHYIKYEGPSAVAMERICVRVRATDNHGETSSWEETCFEAGLPHKEDWQAVWIEPEVLKPIDDPVKALTERLPAPYIRKSFCVNGDLARARVYLSAKGLYQFFLNGKKGSEDCFAPGFTAYWKRIAYQAYEITDFLVQGENVWAIMLGDGWWRGRYGRRLAFIGQIVLDYADGRRDIIGTDESFLCATGGIACSDMKKGETFDSTLEPKGWKEPGYDDSTWKNVRETDPAGDELVATGLVLPCEREKFKPVLVQTPDGKTVLDFGQNIAGYVRFEVDGPEGWQITLLHGERFDENGNFTQANVSKESEGPFQRVDYICDGRGKTEYQPHFAIFGFRYVLVENWPGDVDPDAFTAVAVYSNLKQVGDFSCSHPLINQLVQNSIWSQKSNFLDVPTDCPTRERGPWTGDGQVYCATATGFMDVQSFYRKWLADMAIEQHEDGCITSLIPDVTTIRCQETLAIMDQAGIPHGSAIQGSSCGWGDAATIVPWEMYLAYGDKDALEEAFEMAKKWADYEDAHAKVANPLYAEKPEYHHTTDSELDANYIWDTDFHWGEWLEADIFSSLFPMEDDDISEKRISEVDIDAMVKRSQYGDPHTSTAYYAWSTRLVSEMAEVLGKHELAEQYKKRFEKIRRSYAKYFVRPDGEIMRRRQAPNIRTLKFGLTESEEQRKLVLRKLIEFLNRTGNHLNTGFLSTPFLLPVLAENGYVQLAYEVLEQEDFPSWLYPVKKGFTTIPESWTADDTMLFSLNHYSYGAVCSFLFRYVAGIRPIWEKPGYKEFVLEPLPGGSLTHAETSFESPYGLIKSSWKKEGNQIWYAFTVPANTMAIVRLQANEQIVSDLQAVACTPVMVCEDGKVEAKLPSGKYEFCAVV